MTWSKAKRKARAGKRKCRRCKALWYREKGSTSQACIRCHTHCRRCDVEFTKENRNLSQRNNVYVCKDCHNEITIKSKGNKGWIQRDANLAYRFGITSVEYDAILKAQSGGCWICGKVPLEGQNRLAVDHLHSKGENKRNPREKRGRIRGLLCWQCNSALGKFRDDITKLRRAADYLEIWPAQVILKEK